VAARIKEEERVAEGVEQPVAFFTCLLEIMFESGFPRFGIGSGFGS
jgi:hypothetical protein